MKIQLVFLLSALLIAGCSRLPFSKNKARQPAIQPAADPAIAAATTFSASLVEVDLDKRGTIASGTVTTDAPLATATSGTYSLDTHTTGIVSHAGARVVARLRQKGTGKVRVRRSGNQIIVELLEPGGQPFVQIIGPPHGNAIRSNWFSQGADSGLATLMPR